MRVYNYSEARQNFSSVLNLAMKEEVIIARKDGSKFKVIPIKENETKSPFNVEGIDCNIKTNEILEIIRESREDE
jgi:antitoxin (DNA-binding transcriptional repressor) of toxin-antitoxin stability system